MIAISNQSASADRAAHSNVIIQLRQTSLSVKLAALSLSLSLFTKFHRYKFYEQYFALQRGKKIGWFKGRLKRLGISRFFSRQFVCYSLVLVDFILSNRSLLSHIECSKLSRCIFNREELTFASSIVMQETCCDEIKLPVIFPFEVRHVYRDLDAVPEQE